MRLQHPETLQIYAEVQKFNQQGIEEKGSNHEHSKTLKTVVRSDLGDSPCMSMLSSELILAILTDE